MTAEVAEHAANIVERWPVPSPAWLPRTQERLEVPLCGGRVVLAGVVDLVLGSPAQDRASVCLVELKSGARRIEHRGDLHFYALLEALRSGAPPFRIATYYSGTGELDAEPVDEDTLVGALARVLDGAIRLCRLAAGAEPERRPNHLCAWCVGLPGCAPGQRRAGTDVRARSPPGAELQSGDRMTAVPPRVAWLTDALVAPPTDEVAPTDLARLRDDLVRDLRALGAELPDGERLQIDAFKVRRRASSPRSVHVDRRHVRAVAAHCVVAPSVSRRSTGVCAGTGPESRRGGGRGAGGRSRGRRRGAAGTGAVRAPWWAQWYADCPRWPGRGACRGRHVGDAAPDGGGLAAGCPGRSSGDATTGGSARAGRPLSLKGRADVRSLVGRRPALLVVGSGRCQADWRVELGYPGLVAALGRDAHVGAVPCGRRVAPERTGPGAPPRRRHAARHGHRRRRRRRHMGRQPDRGASSGSPRTGRRRRRLGARRRA